MVAKEKKDIGDEKSFCVLLGRLNAALRATFKVTAKTLARLAENGSPYLNPQQREKVYSEEQRRQKAVDRARREKIIQEMAGHSMSKERKAALAFRYLEEDKRFDLRRMRKLSRTPNMSTAIKTKKLAFFHPGRWMKPEFQGKEMWSCCAGEAKEINGCSHKVIDKMKWQLDV